jgi:hypothetical protein
MTPRKRHTYSHIRGVRLQGQSRAAVRTPLMPNRKWAPRPTQNVARCARLRPTDSVREAIRWLPSKRVRHRTVPRGFRACGKAGKVRGRCRLPRIARLAASGRRREPQSRGVVCGVAGQGTSRTARANPGEDFSLGKERALATSHNAEGGRVSLSGVPLSRRPMNSSPEEGAATNETACRQATDSRPISAMNHPA